MRRLDEIKCKDAGATRTRCRSVACAFLLCAAVLTPAHAQLVLFGGSGADWTVLTVAPDGAWGTATETYVNRAIATAIAQCRALSTRVLGCGAQLVTVQWGWALGQRCGEQNILTSGASLAAVLEDAHRRELELRRLYHSNMPNCRQLVLVAPDGSIKVPRPQAVVSENDEDR